MTVSLIYTNIHGNQDAFHFSVDKVKANEVNNSTIEFPESVLFTLENIENIKEDTSIKFKDEPQNNILLIISIILVVTATLGFIIKRKAKH